jgi:hypothetical protein
LLSLRNTLENWADASALRKVSKKQIADLAAHNQEGRETSGELGSPHFFQIRLKQDGDPMEYCGIDCVKKKHDVIILDTKINSLGKPMTIANTT